MLTIAQQAALKALPQLLPADADERRELFAVMKEVTTAAGELDGEAKHRFDEIEALFDIKPAAVTRRSIKAEARL
jgi:hypothetical protein